MRDGVWSPQTVRQQKMVSRGTSEPKKRVDRAAGS